MIHLNGPLLLVITLTRKLDVPPHLVKQDSFSYIPLISGIVNDLCLVFFPLNCCQIFFPSFPDRMMLESKAQLQNVH